MARAGRLFCHVLSYTPCAPRQLPAERYAKAALSLDKIFMRTIFIFIIIIFFNSSCHYLSHRQYIKTYLNNWDKFHSNNKDLEIKINYNNIFYKKDDIILKINFKNISDKAFLLKKSDFVSNGSMPSNLYINILPTQDYSYFMSSMDFVRLNLPDSNDFVYLLPGEVFIQEENIDYFIKEIKPLNDKKQNREIFVNLCFTYENYDFIPKYGKNAYRFIWMGCVESDTISFKVIYE